MVCFDFWDVIHSAASRLFLFSFMEIFCASLNFKNTFLHRTTNDFAEMRLSLLLDVLLRWSALYVGKKSFYMTCWSAEILQKYGTKLNEYIWHPLGTFVLFLALCSATCGSPTLPLGSLSTAAHTLTRCKYLIQLHFRNKTKKQTPISL